MNVCLCPCVYLPEGEGEAGLASSCHSQEGCVLRVMGDGDRSALLGVWFFSTSKLCALRQALSPL